MWQRSAWSRCSGSESADVPSSSPNPPGNPLTVPVQHVPDLNTSHHFHPGSTSRVFNLQQRNGHPTSPLASVQWSQDATPCQSAHVTAHLKTSQGPHLTRAKASVFPVSQGPKRPAPDTSDPVSRTPSLSFTASLLLRAHPRHPQPQNPALPAASSHTWANGTLAAPSSLGSNVTLSVRPQTTPLKTHANSNTTALNTC